jgi:hypothetical protein
MRAALSLTDANGGYLVPFTLDPTVILTNAGIAGPLRSISTVKTIATDTWNGVTSAGVSAAWTAEGTETADAPRRSGSRSSPPRRPTPGCSARTRSWPTPASPAELARLLADAKDRLEEAAFADGQHRRHHPARCRRRGRRGDRVDRHAAATNAFAVGDIYNTSDALRPRDASQASWIGNKKIFSADPAVRHRRRRQLLGQPRHGHPEPAARPAQYEASTMTGVVSTGANILLAGNFAEYYIVDRVGMSRDVRPDGQVHRQRPAHRTGRMVRVLAGRRRRRGRQRVPPPAAQPGRRGDRAGLMADLPVAA